jgi:hypothetical protein
MPKSKDTHPIIKNNPPMGVIMPTGPMPTPFILSNDMAYNEPLNSRMPIIKKDEASLTLLNGNDAKAIPVTSNAKLW